MNFTVNDTLDNNETIAEEWAMELAPRICWDILFGSMILVAVVGNSIVLWIVAGKICIPNYLSTYSSNQNVLQKFLSGILKLAFNHLLNFCKERIL